MGGLPLVVLVGAGLLVWAGKIPVAALYGALGLVVVAMIWALVGKVGGVFTSTASQHGGQETTLISMQTFLFHQGMVVVGVPYAAQELLNMKEITGGSPYGSTTITDAQGQRLPSDNELAIARFQGKHTTEIGAKLAAK